MSSVMAVWACNELSGKSAFSEKNINPLLNLKMDISSWPRTTVEGCKGTRLSTGAREGHGNVPEQARPRLQSPSLSFTELLS